jgi:hypothetical protein
MLIISSRRRHRSGSFTALALVVIGLTLSLFASVARADFPTLKSNGDGTKTVAWWMNTTQGVTPQGVDLSSGNVTLPWRPQNVTWDAPGSFTSNGTLGANLSTIANGISLRSDPTNHVPDGDFATAGPWSYATSPAGNVTAKWNATNQLAVFRHASPSTESLWDGLNSTSGWSATSSPGAFAGIWENTTGKREGLGMLGLNLTLPSGLGSYAGAQHLAPVNWSRFDRMVLWILPLDVSSPLAFNITAFVGAIPRNSTARPLHAGWQEVAVDLKELGPVRDTLVSLTLRVNGRNVPSTKTVYFDDVRVGVAKKFDETASVHQTFQKSIATWGVSGSASLRFNWTIANATGVVRVMGTANLSGPSGSFERTFGGPPRLGWTGFFADVSRTTATAGVYNVGIALEVVADNTSISSADARVDDVSLGFPNRHNGSYLSNAVALGERSEFLRIAWSCDLFSATAVRMSIRSGNSPIPGDASWGAWQYWPSTGTYPLSIPGAAYIQVGVDLATTNASQSPQLHAMDLATRHRADSGSIISGIFNVPSSDPFLRWRSIRAVAQAPTGTSISFSIGDGTYFQTVAPDGNLSAFAMTSIRWKAVVATTDGLVTPSVARVELVYEIRAAGEAAPGLFGAYLPFMWYGGALLVAAVLGYVGYVFVIRRMFSIDDLFLISKDGRLLMHNTRRMRADRDPDILSAMLTAILSFLRDSDPEGNGELRRFQIGDKTTILERGVHAYLAAVYSGRVPRWAGKDLRRFMANLESRFGESFARWTGDPEDLQGLREFTGRFVSHSRYRPPRRVTGRAS